MFGGTDATDMLWRSGLAAVPLVLVVAGICRCLPCRPWTRHVLWVTVLALMVLLLGAPLLPRVDVAALGRLLPKVEAGEKTPAPRGAAPTTNSGLSASERAVPALPAVPSGSAVRASEPASENRRLGDARAPSPRHDVGAPGQATSPAPTPTAVPAAVGSTARVPPTVHPVNALRSGTAEASQSQKPTAIFSDEPSTARVVAPPPLAVIQELATETTAAPAEIQKSTPARASFAVPPAPSAPVDRGLVTTGASGPGPVLPAVREKLGRFLRACIATGARWQSGLTALRDNLFSLPSVPPELWLLGAVSIAIVGFFQIVRCRRLITRARPAPESVTLLVRGAARTLGLRRVPEVLMVDDRVSPMVWCAVHPRLVLPAPLWAELDLIGRSAVIHHELAHLKRRDHWVCWLEMLVGLVYWWHPLAWFVRRRVREEADLCCDAWVTTLFPRDRRAYAQALLETRKYVSGAGLGAPALGLTVMSAGARRFARRLTMVMTQRVRPGRSIAGTVLSLALGAGALVTSPLWACPPEKEKDQAQGHVRATAATPAPTVPKARISGRPSTPRAPRATTSSPAVAWPTPPAPPVPPAAAAFPAPPAPPAAPTPPSVGMTWRAFSVPGAAPSPEPGDSTFERHMTGHDRSAPAAHTPQPPGSGLDRIERRLEELSQRLDEFARRLDGEGVRERRPATPRPTDPVRRPRSDAGTALYQDALAPLEGEHATSITGPCVIAVDPSGNVKVWRLRDGSLESVAELMGRSNAPLVYDGNAHAAVGLGQAFNADTLKRLALLEGRLADARVKVSGPAALKGLLEVQSMQLDKERQALGEALKSGAAAPQRATDHLRKRIEEITARAHEINHRADQMEEEADRVREKSDETAGGERDALLSEAEALTTEAERVREEAELLSEQAEALSEQVEEIAQSVWSLDDENEGAAAAASDASDAADAEDPAETPDTDTEPTPTPTDN